MSFGRYIGRINYYSIKLGHSPFLYWLETSSEFKNRILEIATPKKTPILMFNKSFIDPKAQELLDKVKIKTFVKERGKYCKHCNRFLKFSRKDYNGEHWRGHDRYECLGAWEIFNKDHIKIKYKLDHFEEEQEEQEEKEEQKFHIEEEEEQDDDQEEPMGEITDSDIYESDVGDFSD
tara:strand:- start:1193 stop:1723 length:531 start_codon:yes stop_codon:yes gene_type:complete